jgi:hypothetical protein
LAKSAERIDGAIMISRAMVGLDCQALLDGTTLRHIPVN